MNRTELVEARVPNVQLDITVRISLYCMALALTVARPSSGGCQSAEVPGRELLAFPVGLVAEPGALPGMFGGGFWNPAAARVPDGSRWRLSAAAMSTPADVSVNAHAGAISGDWRGSTITLSVVRASVAGLVRTESDPLTITSDLQYSTMVTSVGFARRLRPNVMWGVAARVRTGQIEVDHRTAVSLDAGFTAEHLTRFDARVGASTFLASPWSRGAEHETLVAGADVRVVHADSDRVVRVGIAASSTQGAGSEQFLFASARYRVWEVRGGPVRTMAYGDVNLRSRLGVALHFGGYAVGVARESAPGGIGPSYQFVLGSLLP